MNYIELNVRCSDEMAEILTAELAEFPFDSFATEPDTLKAYIPHERLADCHDRVEAMLAGYGISEHRYIAIETQNWNALWESNFPPVEVDGEVAIRAPFHAPYPDYRFDIVITPKMSFGTGHHATTFLMSRATAARDFAGKRVLDMGSGTGAPFLWAVDGIRPQSVRNRLQNGKSKRNGLVDGAKRKTCVNTRRRRFIHK